MQRGWPLSGKPNLNNKVRQEESDLERKHSRATYVIRWVPIAMLGDEALSNVMRKAIARGWGEKGVNP